MKKMILLVLVVLAAVFLSACRGGANVEFILGTWEFYAEGDSGRGADFRTWKFMDDYSFMHQYGSEETPDAFMGRFEVVEKKGNQLTLSIQISLASEGIVREDVELVVITVDTAADTITIAGDTYTRVPAPVEK